MKIEQAEYSETSAYKLQTPGNYPKESIQHTQSCKLAIMCSQIAIIKRRVGNTFSDFEC